MTRKPPRLVVLVLLFWQVAASMGVTVAHGAAPLDQRGPATLSGHHASASTAAACPDHAAASSREHAPTSNHSSTHDCCGGVSACQCVTAAIPFATPLLAVRAFATPVPLLAHTGAATAPIVPFFRPPIA